MCCALRQNNQRPSPPIHLQLPKGHPKPTEGISICWDQQYPSIKMISTFFMNAISCLDIFSLLIFNAATFGIILKPRHKPQISEQHQKSWWPHSLSSLYLMPRSLARLSWRSMMLCRISSTSCLSSLSSIREMEKSGSRKEGGNAVDMDLDLKPDVTCGARW